MFSTKKSQKILSLYQKLDQENQIAVVTFLLQVILGWNEVVTLECCECHRIYGISWLAGDQGRVPSSGYCKSCSQIELAKLRAYKLRVSSKN